MKSVTIYTLATCPYCIRAIGLLKQKKVTFKEIKIDFNAKLKAQMVQRANGRTSVPQIFIGEQHIGGCDDLIAQERAGKLDALLAAG
ncbi:MAG: glutaredoxin 3 [Robiginitomaculum sp.]